MLFRDFGVPELLIIMVIVLLLFGPGRIGKVAGEIGRGIRSFREGMNGNKNEQSQKVEQLNQEEKKQLVWKKFSAGSESLFVLADQFALLIL